MHWSSVDVNREVAMQPGRWSISSDTVVTKIPF